MGKDSVEGAYGIDGYWILNAMPLCDVSGFKRTVNSDQRRGARGKFQYSGSGSVSLSGSESKWVSKKDHHEDREEERQVISTQFSVIRRGAGCEWRPKMTASLLFTTESWMLEDLMSEGTPLITKV